MTGLHKGTVYMLLTVAGWIFGRVVEPELPWSGIVTLWCVVFCVLTCKAAWDDLF